MKNLKRFLALFLLAGLPSMSSAMDDDALKSDIKRLEVDRSNLEFGNNPRLEEIKKEVERKKLEEMERQRKEEKAKRGDIEWNLFFKAQKLGFTQKQLEAFVSKIKKIDDFQGLEKVDEFLDSLLRSSWFNPNRSWSDFGRHSSQALSKNLYSARDWTYENVLKPGYNLVPAPIKKMYDGYNNYYELSCEQQRELDRELDSAIRVLQALSLFGGSVALGRAHARAVQAERQAYAKAHQLKYIPELDKYRKD